MYIKKERRKTADVVRLSSTRDSNNDVLAETYDVVYGAHVVDLVPDDNSEAIANEQHQLFASYLIFPREKTVGGYARLRDFYRINNKLYRIFAKKDFVENVYFEVRDDAPEQATSIAVAVQNSFVIDNLGPGVYTYGSGVLLGVGPFAARPLLLETLMNDGGGYFVNPSMSGFEIVNTGEGASPIYTVVVKGVLA